MGFNAIFKKMYPFLHGAAIAGGPLAVMAADMVGKGLGVDKVEPTVDGINQAILDAQKTNPEALLKLQESEQDFKLQMAKLGIDSEVKMEEFAEKDRDSARAREIAVRDNTPKILAYMVITMTVLGEGYLLIHGMPNMDQSYAVILGRILGTFDAALITVLNYYFGSSRGSQNKDETIAQIGNIKDTLKLIVGGKAA